MKQYIISSDERFEEFYGMRADKKRKLYNGMIRCNLFMYYQPLEKRKRFHSAGRGASRQGKAQNQRGMYQKKRFSDHK